MRRTGCESIAMNQAAALHSLGEANPLLYADVCDAIPERLSETAKRLFIPVDLSSMQRTQFLSDEPGKRENKLGIVVNNVGAI